MLPNANVAIKDGGLGLMPAGTSGIFAAVGSCSLGTNEQIYIFSDPATAEDTLDQGTLVERILDAFSKGARKILAVKADPTGGTAAAAGTPAAAAGNSSTGTVTTSGTPKNDRDFALKITDGGASGALAGGGVKIRISKNGGITYDPEIPLQASSPQTIALGNGSNVILTDNATPAGSFVEDDSWTWSCSEAKPTTQKVIDAVEVAAVSDEIEFIHVCDVTDSTFWASLSSFNAELIAKNKYIFYLVEADKPGAADTTDEWVDDLLTESATFFDENVAVSAAWGLVADRNGVSFTRNEAGLIAGLISSLKVHQSIGWVGGTDLNNVLAVHPGDLSDGHIETLDNLGRYLTMRYWPGQGFRITGGRTMAALTSDYQYLEFLRPAYKAAKLVRAVVIPFVNSNSDASGLIALQKTAEAPLDRMAADGEIDGYEVLIPSGQDITGTGTVRVSLTVIVKGVMRTIELTFGLGKKLAA